MSAYNRIEKSCLHCSKTILVIPSVEKRGGGKYCSNSCKNLFNWSKPEYRKTMSEAHKGQIPANLKELIAYSKSPEGRKNNSEKNRGRIPWNKGTGSGMNSRGYRFVIGNTRKREHRQVMEDEIGRELKKLEIVHHWDKVTSNNEISNLCLMRSQSAHKRLHHFADRHGIEIKKLRFKQPWLTPNR